MNDSAIGEADQPSRIENYYRFHSAIYDATRWTFLFGRNAILTNVSGEPNRILEVGCGTGRNLTAIASRFPNSTITGLDLSKDMLRVARRRAETNDPPIELLNAAYDEPVGGESGFDLILFSYALSMFNPGFEAAIEAAEKDLAPGGQIAVVDFHDTPHPAFERWMGVNHVRMNAQLLPKLEALFDPVEVSTEKAYGGVWRYLMYVGRRR